MSDKILFFCKGCGGKFEVPQNLAGRVFKCQVCKTSLTVPNRSESPAVSNVQQEVPPQNQQAIPPRRMTERKKMVLIISSVIGSSLILWLIYFFVLGPVLEEKKLEAKKAESMSHLSSIALYMKLFGGELNDKNPESIGVALAYYNLPQNSSKLTFYNRTPPSTKILVSPMSGRKPPQIDAKGNVIGEVDYIYFELMDDVPGDTIWAYERPENYNNKGTVILFYNASVGWVDKAKFDRLMADSAEMHKQGKGKGINPFKSPASSPREEKKAPVPLFPGG